MTEEHISIAVFGRHEQYQSELLKERKITETVRLLTQCLTAKRDLGRAVQRPQ